MSNVYKLPLPEELERLKWISRPALEKGVHEFRVPNKYVYTRHANHIRGRNKKLNESSRSAFFKIVLHEASQPLIRVTLKLKFVVKGTANLDSHFFSLILSRSVFVFSASDAG